MRTALVVGLLVGAALIVRASWLARSETARRRRALRAANESPFTGFQAMQARYLRSLN